MSTNILSAAPAARNRNLSSNLTKVVVVEETISHPLQLLLEGGEESSSSFHQHFNSYSSGGDGDAELGGGLERTTTMKTTRITQFISKNSSEGGGIVNLKSNGNYSSLQTRGVRSGKQEEDKIKEGGEDICRLIHHKVMASDNLCGLAIRYKVRKGDIIKCNSNPATSPSSSSQPHLSALLRDDCLFMLDCLLIPPPPSSSSTSSITTPSSTNFCTIKGCNHSPPPQTGHSCRHVPSSSSTASKVDSGFVVSETSSSTSSSRKNSLDDTNSDTSPRIRGSSTSFRLERDDENLFNDGGGVVRRRRKSPSSNSSLSSSSLEFVERNDWNGERTPSNLVKPNENIPTPTPTSTSIASPKTFTTPISKEGYMVFESHRNLTFGGGIGMGSQGDFRTQVILSSLGGVRTPLPSLPKVKVVQEEKRRGDVGGRRESWMELTSFMN